MQRRMFLKLAGAATAASLAPFRALSQLASGTADEYKALVCVFMYGGNDSNNMIIPLDSTRYGIYSSARSALTIPQSQILPLQQTSFGIHPSMPGAQRLFNETSLAVIANMGTLIQPTTKAQIQANIASLPDNLGSHPDQRNCMCTALQTSGFSSGWGGRIFDVLGSGSSTIPGSVSLYGGTPFVNGVQTPGFIPPSTASDDDPESQSIYQLASGVTLVQMDQRIYATLSTMNEAYLQAIKSAPQLPLEFPATGTAGQLAQVATIMGVREALGATRQIFFVGIQGFDTHFNQLNTHASLLAELDGAIVAFSQALQAMNLYEQVTLFTLSDFTRTLQMNGSGGSDHGWGGHQLIMGGAVKGRAIYGTFPDLELGGADDMYGTGGWIPTTSLNQYAATLASWFGVSASDLHTVLPDLVNFSTTNLGFV